jgi:hypothetical protein
MACKKECNRCKCRKQRKALVFGEIFNLIVTAAFCTMYYQRCFAADNTSLQAEKSLTDSWVVSPTTTAPVKRYF